MTPKDKSIYSSARAVGSIASGLAVGLAIFVGAALIVTMLIRFNAAMENRQYESQSQPQSPEARLSHGKAVFARNCTACHGNEGRGDGPAAVMLDPRPRDFHIGKYRLVNTSNGVPTRDNLIHTIRNGMAGTSMPAWIMLTDNDIDCVADYVLILTRESLKEQLAAKTNFKGKKLDTIVDNRLTPTGVLTLPPEPAITDAGLARGKELYLQTCAKCHNDDGSGKQDPTWKTAEGFPIASRNFTSGVYKGGGRASDLYTRVYAGLPGTPMPGFGAAYKSDDLWNIVHYVQTLARGPKASSANATNVIAAPLLSASLARGGQN